jgi:hypothetical protein
MSRRYRGFVVGSELSRDGRSVWSVRVKDPGSGYDGQKLVVASVHGGLELARGLNVNFVIGTLDDQSGSPALRAVDIRLEIPSQPFSKSGGRS